MECQEEARAPRAFIFKGFQRRRAFSLQVYRGCVVARYIFKWFFALRGPDLAKVFVIYRFRPLWLSRCVSGEGLVRSRWLAPVRGVLRHLLYIFFVNSR